MKLSQSGRVASLQLHPTEPGAPLVAVESIEVVEQMEFSASRATLSA
jgi:hypothetical protein